MITQTAAEQAGKPLTRCELEVLRLVAMGCTSKEIADSLYVSKRTVDFHLQNIYDKLRANNRMKAVNAARQCGLL